MNSLTAANDAPCPPFTSHGASIIIWADCLVGARPLRLVKEQNAIKTYVPVHVDTEYARPQQVAGGAASVVFLFRGRFD